MIKDFIQQNTGIALSKHAEEKLETYYRFLTEENAKYNLTAITEREEVYTKHFADSMLGSVAVPQNAACATLAAERVFRPCRLNWRVRIYV